MRLTFAIVILLAAIPSFGACTHPSTYPCIWFDPVQTAFSASKIAAGSSDWVNLRDQVDLYVGYPTGGSDAYSVQYQTPQGSGPSTIRGYACGSASSPGNIQGGFTAALFQNYVEQFLSYYYMVANPSSSTYDATRAGLAYSMIVCLAKAWIQPLPSLTCVTCANAPTGLVRYGVGFNPSGAGSDLANGNTCEVLLPFNTNKNTGFTAGDVWSLSGMAGSGCNGNQTVSAVVANSTVAFASAVTCTNNSAGVCAGTAYATSPTYGQSGSSPYFMDLFAKLYDIAYGDCATWGVCLNNASLLPQITSTALAWCTELGTYNTAYSHPENNFVARYIMALEEVVDGIGGDSVPVNTACQAGVTRFLDNPNWYAQYHGHWLNGGGNGEGWNDYGQDSNWRVIQGEYTAYENGKDWRTSPLNFSSLGDTLLYWPEFTTPTGLALDGDEYSFNRGNSYCPGASASTTSAITSTGSQTVSVGNTQSMQVNQQVFITGSDGHSELVEITAITTGVSITANFTLTHVSGSSISGACGSTWYPKEVTYVPANDALFYSYVAARMGEPNASLFKDYYDYMLAAESATAGAPSGIVPPFTQGASPYQSIPSLQYLFLFSCPSGDAFNPAGPPYCPTNTADWTTLPLFYCGWDGDYCVTHSELANAAACEVSLLGGPTVGTSGNGHTQFDSGVVAMQCGNNRLLVYGLEEASRSADIISTNQHATLQDIRGTYGNPMNSVYWCDATSADTRNQGLTSKIPPPGQSANQPTWPSSITRTQDSSSFTYMMATGLSANGAKSSVDNDIRQSLWIRELLFLRPKLLIVHDTTECLDTNSEFFEKMIWDMPRTPTQIVTGVPSGMTAYRVVDPSAQEHGVTWTVLPTNSTVNIVNQNSMGFLFRNEVTTSAASICFPNSCHTWLEVMDGAQSTSVEASLAYATCTQADCVQVVDSTNSIDATVAFVTTDPRTSGTVTIEYGTAVETYVANLTPGASYYYQISGGGSSTTLTICATSAACGSSTNTLAASSAGVALPNTAPITLTGIALVPTSLSLLFGALPTQVTATCTYSSGSTSTCNGSGLAWSSSNNLVATVDGFGNVTPVGVGTTTISASEASSSCSGGTCNSSPNTTVTVTLANPGSIFP